MRGWSAIYYREMLILKRRFFKQLASMSVTPLLYIIAFGFGMGKDMSVNGRSYVEFLIPGLIAMSGMNHSFAIASEINITRFYWKIFEEFQAAPIRNIAYVTGEVLAGVTRAAMSVVVIIAIAFVFGIHLSYGGWFWLGVFLNSFVFASIAVAAAMVVKSHADQNMLTSFIITPMAFLGGTVFPVEKLPGWAQAALNLLPLTHASTIIRTASFGAAPDPAPFLILVATSAVCFVLALYSVGEARN